MDLGPRIIGDSTMSDTLQLIGEAALRTTPSASTVTVAVTYDGRRSHHNVRSAVGAHQAHAATPSGAPYVIRDTSRPGLDASFRRVAFDEGVRSVLTMPMRTTTSSIGCLVLHASEPDAFSAATAARLRPLADHAAELVVRQHQFQTALRLGDELRTALESRATIEQAKAVISLAHGCDPEEAFEDLRRRSQLSNTKVRDLAADIVRQALPRR